ncbi:hypothetical protein [Thiovibrio frasassiensis]|uniref:Pilus assembly protein PilM n=1 Tax=Thiovibrio frasassiensis TaxID=2984131 RepID=A0A9X4RQP6_9BACT|nr:hypothetical protein [Thiovibrio frasassiensis]MDG4476452.1 hypothetical protein [Thiovibrio frasassiensis]
MKLPFNNKRYLALTGDSESTMLAEVSKGPSGMAQLHVLATTDSAITADVTIPRLLAGVGSLHGLVSMALPLTFFEVLTTTIPAMPDGAVGKALPYHLAKALHQPLNEFIYDWQITGRFKDRLQITVYLFPAGLFHKIRREFMRKQIKVSFLEPDVFAAFTFLFQEKMVPPHEASLCVLLWQDSISLAVYEKGKLPLIRTVKALQPQGEICFQSPMDIELPSATDLPKLTDDLLILVEEPPQFEEQVDTASILADFSILSSKESSGGKGDPTPAAAFAASQEETDTASWTDYLHKIPLEILRTRDYYASIQKGAAIRNIFVGGADGFWPELLESSNNLLGAQCKSLTSTAGGPDCSPLLHVLALGTGARW